MWFPRLHLVEFEDEPWFPRAIRDYATDYLHFVEMKMGMHRPIADILAPVLEATHGERVVDLCSGGSGPIVAVQQELGAGGRALTFTLTDRYPNVAAFERASRASGGAIDYVSEPVDARAVPPALNGFRTLFNSFHHFRPADALAILRDAARAGQPIAVIDAADRRAVNLLGILAITPIMVQLTAPLIRPFKWSRLFWTYIVPLIPFTCWWDGIVSQLRAYTLSELRQMADEVNLPGYAWEVGQRPFEPAPGRLTYIIGSPTNKGESTV